MPDDTEKTVTSPLIQSPGSRFVLDAKMGSHREEAVALMDWIEHNRSSRFLQQVVAQVQDRYFFLENDKDDHVVKAEP